MATLRRYSVPLRDGFSLGLAVSWTGFGSSIPLATRCPCHRSSVVEHTLGKGEVMGSSPIGGFHLSLVLRVGARDNFGSDARVGRVFRFVPDSHAGCTSCSRRKQAFLLWSSQNGQGCI